MLGAPACRPLRPETRAGRRGAWAETALGRPARASALRVTPPFAVGQCAWLVPSRQRKAPELAYFPLHDGLLCEKLRAKV